jgi:hypothetical protein
MPPMLRYGDLSIRFRPPGFSQPAVPRPPHQATPEISPSPILRSMSRTSKGALRLAASHCSGLLLSPGAAAIAASEGWQPAGALECPKGVFRGCAPEAPAVKCRLNVLYVSLEAYIQKRETPSNHRCSPQ